MQADVCQKRKSSKGRSERQHEDSREDGRTEGIKLLDQTKVSELSSETVCVCVCAA